MASSHDNLDPAVVIVAWIFTVIAIAVVIARYYTHMTILRKVIIHDLLILLTLMFDIANSIFITVSFHHGLGRHAEFLKPGQVENVVKWAYLNEVFPKTGPGIGRISFAILLYAIVPPSKWHRKYLSLLMALQSKIVTVVLSYTQCRPISYYWDRSVH